VSKLHRGSDDGSVNVEGSRDTSADSGRLLNEETAEGHAKSDGRLEDDIRDLVEGFVAKDTKGRLRNVKMLSPLAQAMNEIDYSVLILDLNFRIVFANACATRTSEYPLEEIVGANPRIFGSDWHSKDFYDEQERIVRTGLPWHGIFINRRKTGVIYQEDTTISPVFDEDESIIAYVAVKQELTGNRSVEGDLALATSDREAITQIMREVSPTDNLGETAQSFCEEVVRVSGIEVAIVLHPFGGSKMRTLAASGTTAYDPTKAEPFIARVSSSVLEYVAAGPARLSLTRREWSGGEEFHQRLVEDGAVWIVAVPIKFGGKMISALILASRDPLTEKSIDLRLPFFEQLGSFAGALLGYRSMQFELDEDQYAFIKDLIDARHFTMVFQPIIDLATSQPVGYEALTRFEDGVSPAEHFADAHVVGLGGELECATAAAALRAAESLPEKAFLCLNFSATAILDGSAADVVRGAIRQVVIEITEHDLATDYVAIREAIMGMEGCQLSIDDMGAGYTSLSQVVELAPNFLKLDISLIHNIDTNFTRQALVESLCRFAARTGITVIAEGVETAAESEMIRSLGSSMEGGRLLAQGYFFGFPTSIGRTDEVAPRR